MIANAIKSNRFLFSAALIWRQIMGKSTTQPQLRPEQKSILSSLKRDGVVAIPNFLTEAQCQALISDFEAVDSDRAQLYENDKRIFGIDKLKPRFKELFADQTEFRQIGEAYLGEKLILQSTMCNKIVPQADAEYGSGGSWHRDSFSRQFKAIVYLDDVGENNGPFQYIKGSHTLGSILRVMFGLKSRRSANDPRYTEQEIEQAAQLCHQTVTEFVAPKGTLILADIRGLHTGKAIKEGHRYAIFNYYVGESWYQPDNEISRLTKANYV